MKNSTDITIVLDRSGSMQSIARETITGFNTFLAEQKYVKGNARLTLVQFDHEYELLYQAKDIQNVVSLNTETYIPRGMTALLDAIGKTIELTRERMKVSKESEAHSKVIFVVITDGHENNSRIYTRSRIFEKISKMEKKHGWQFVFLGANQDAIEEAGFIGIHKDRAMTFAADGRGAEDSFQAINFCMKEVRENDVPFAFTDEQRKEQERAKKDNTDPKILSN